VTAERPAYDRDDPVKVAENADWLAARRQDGFEHVAIDYWRLCRFLYSEELLAATRGERRRLQEVRRDQVGLELFSLIRQPRSSHPGRR
jgi:hypothetical protein